MVVNAQRELGGPQRELGTLCREGFRGSFLMMLEGPLRQRMKMA